MVKDWILLRGLSREQRHWGGFITDLQVAMPDSRFYCLDLPGVGTQLAEESPCTVEGIRRKLQLAQRQAAIAGPFGLIGLSLGGMLALDWMAASAEVQAVIVINSSASDVPLRWRLRPAALGRGLRALLSPQIEQRERLILGMGSARYADDPDLLRVWADIQRDAPVKSLTLVKQLLAAARFSLPANTHSTPGLVLTSDADAMVSPHCSETIARHYQWPLCRHPDAGHDLPLDAPQWVAKKILEWVSAQ